MALGFLGVEILTRASLLSVILLIAIGLVVWAGYRQWQAGPWDLPTPLKGAAIASSSPTLQIAAARPNVGTEAIISRNIFDPERGAGATREAEENSRAFQRVRGLVLLGTMVIGENRTAIVLDGTNPTPGIPQPARGTAGAAPMRLKLGDNIEGFRLAEIADKRVVFTKDGTRVEVLLDYFRKVEVAQPVGGVPGQPSGPGQVVIPTRPTVPGQVAVPPPGAPVPRVLPNLPRRSRVPIPPDQGPAS